MATGPRSKFPKGLALMKGASEDEAYGAAIMTANKRLQCQIPLSDAETEATTWSLADTEWVTNQLEREIHDITLNGQKQFKTEFSIRLIEFEAWWETIGIQALRKSIEQQVIILDMQRCILGAISQSQLGEWVPVTISPPIFLNGYISPT